MTNYAFVLDANGKQLAPTKEQKAWYLIRKKRATLVSKYPMVIQLNKEISTEILVPKTRIEFRNRAEGEVINLDKVPDNIKVMITHSSNEINIGENDIKIYVDLLENDRKSGLYSLKYTTLLDLYTIKLEPEKIRIN